MHRLMKPAADDPRQETNATPGSRGLNELRIALKVIRNQAEAILYHWQTFTYPGSNSHPDPELAAALADLRLAALRVRRAAGRALNLPRTPEDVQRVSRAAEEMERAVQFLHAVVPPVHSVQNRPAPSA